MNEQNTKQEDTKQQNTDMIVQYNIGLYLENHKILKLINSVGDNIAYSMFIVILIGLFLFLCAMTSKYIALSLTIITIIATPFLIASCMVSSFVSSYFRKLSRQYLYIHDGEPYLIFTQYSEDCESVYKKAKKYQEKAKKELGKAYCDRGSGFAMLYMKNINPDMMLNERSDRPKKLVVALTNTETVTVKFRNDIKLLITRFENSERRQRRP